MIQGRQHLRFPFEAREAIGIVGEQVRQHLQRDVAIELRVARPINLTHAAHTEAGANLERPYSSAGLQLQRYGSSFTKMLRNWTSAGMPVYTPSFTPP